MKPGWQIKTLEEIAEIKGGKRVPKGYKLLAEETPHPYVTVSDFTDDGTIDTSGLRYVSSDVFEQIKRYTISSSDLYLSIAGTIGKTGYVPPELDGASLTENACKLVLRPAIDRDFVYYFTKTDEFSRQAGSNTRIAAQPKLALERLKTIKLQIPTSLPEQQRIVGILDEAFDGIATAKANAEKNLQNARALFESHLNSVFTQRGPGWVEDLVGSVCEIKHGFSFDGMEFSHDVPEGKPIVITPGNFTENGELLFNDRNTKRFSGDVPTGFRFDIGDLVVVMTDLSSKMKILGKPAFVQTDDVLHNQRIGRVVFLNSRIHKRFLYYFMMCERFLKNIKASATGTMVKHTAPKRILSNVIPFPRDQKEQLSVVARFDAIREETQCLESIYKQRLAAMEELKKSLLHQAFSGAL